MKIQSGSKKEEGAVSEAIPMQILEKEKVRAKRLISKIIKEYVKYSGRS